MEKEGGDLGGEENVRRVLEEKWIGIGGNGREKGWWEGNKRWRLRWPDWEQVFDGLVEGLVE